MDAIGVEIYIIFYNLFTQTIKLPRNDPQLSIKTSNAFSSLDYVNYIVHEMSHECGRQKKSTLV